MRDKPLFIASLIFFLLYLIFIIAVFSPLKRLFSPFITALALVYAFLPLVRLLSRLKIKEPIAVLTAYGIVVLLALFSVMFATPKILGAVGEVWKVVSEFIGKFNVEKYTGDIFKTSATGVYSTVVSAAKGAFDAFVGVVAAFYIMSDTKRVKKAFEEIIPEKLKAPCNVLADDVKFSFDSFFKGQLLIAFILFLIDGVFLFAVGVPYAWGLALIAAILDIVPYVGTFAAIGIIMIVTLLACPAKFLIVLIGLLLIQQIENNLITPKISSDTLALHPAVTVLCLYVGTFGGFWGILLAIPLTSVFKKLCIRLVQAIV